jgi:acetyl-CoA carboxylase biotin carboxylase subunit
VIEGIKTTAPLHRRIMDHPDFIAGTFSTKWMDTFLEELKRNQPGIRANGKSDKLDSAPP